MRSRALLPRIAAGTALGVLTLTGCSLRPGVAVEVGDVDIANARVDEVTAAVCEVEGEAYETPVALAVLKTVVLQALVDGALAEDVAEQYDVAPGPESADAVAQASESLTDQPAGVRDDYLEVVRAATYAQDVLTQAAQAELAGSGEEVSEESVARAVTGIRSLAARDADIEVDPRYGLSYVDGVPTPDTGASVPVSDSAVAAATAVSGAATGQGDPEYAASLPASQVCGG